MKAIKRIKVILSAASPLVRQIAQIWLLCTFGFVACESSPTSTSTDRIEPVQTQQPPETVGFADIAAWFPEASKTAKLDSFYLLPKAVDPSPFRVPTHLPPGLSQALTQLGWQIIAQADYTLGSTRRISIVLGLRDVNVLAHTYHWLLSHRRHLRKNRRRKRKKSTGKKKQPLSDLQAKSSLPLPRQMRMPWGKSSGLEIHRLSLGTQRRPLSKTPLFSARLGSTPDAQAMALILFNTKNATDKLFATRTGAKTSWEHLVDSVLTQLSQGKKDSEALTMISMERFGSLFPSTSKTRRKKRKTSLTRYRQLPIYWATMGQIETQASSYQLGWLSCSSSKQATLLYEKGIIARWRHLARRSLRKKKGRFTSPLTSLTIGEVKGIHFNGQTLGQLQEIAFHKGERIWFARTASVQRGGLSQPELLIRLSSLPPWNTTQPAPGSVP